MIVGLLWFLWSIVHWIYLFCHLVCGPLAAYIAYRKNYVRDDRGVALAIALFLFGPMGLVIAALLREWPEGSW